MEINEEMLLQLPKIVLHDHLDGGLRPETVQEWLQEDGIEIPLDEVKDKLMVEKDCRDLNQYLEKFALPVQLLQSKEHLKRAVYERYEDLHNQGVIYAEVRFAPQLHTAKGLSYWEIVEAAVEGLNEAKEKFGIDGALILCAMRGEGEENKEVNIETVKVAKDFLNKGVCAIDLAGAEALFPTKNFKYVFDEATKLNIPYTIHAGEADGPDSIKEAIKFGAPRIGHGVRCIEDPGLMGYLSEHEIPLEVCVTSNLQTQATPNDKAHPLEELYKLGIKATINTDNDTVSNTNLIDEYKWILRNTGLKIGDIIDMNINAIRGLFTSPQMKAKLIGIIRQFESAR